MVLIAITPLSAAQIMLLIDRYLGGHFFDTQAGGSAVLWMHFFWIFGHPEVYVLIIPCFAFMSEIIPVFSRKPIFGYPVMVAAPCASGRQYERLGAHMFTIGMNSYANSFFTLTTMAVGVPTGIKISIGSAPCGWKDPIQDTDAGSASDFCSNSSLQLTGIMMAASPFDWQLSLSYFVGGALSLRDRGEFCSRSLPRFIMVSQNDWPNAE